MFIVSHFFWSVNILQIIPQRSFSVLRGNDGKSGPAGGDNEDDSD